MLELPRSSTDLRIAVPCHSCSMMGKIAGSSCDYCGGTGWILKSPDRLSPVELERLRNKLPEPPAEG
jgi:hypothetical protein